MVGGAGTDLHLEAESVRITRVRQELLRLGGVVGEELLYRRGHLLERLVVAVVVGMHRIGEELRIAAVVRAGDLLLVHRHVERAAHADVAEGLLVDPQGEELPIHGEPPGPLELRRAFLQVVDRRPADRFQYVELAGAQRGVLRGLVLDGSALYSLNVNTTVYLSRASTLAIWSK